MKKIFALVLAVLMTLSMAACAPSETPETTGAPEGTTAPAKTMLPGTMEELITNLTTQVPVEFMGGAMPVNLTDTTEDGLWAIKYYTGLETPEKLTEAVFFEPMMGSIAFSLVAVRVADASEAQAIAQQMKAGIDARKWICVEANDIMVAGYGDVVMFIMLDNTSGMSAQAYVDAFKGICGAELDFVI